MIKDPILIKTDKEINKLDEKILHKYIMDLCQVFRHIFMDKLLIRI